MGETKSDDKPVDFSFMHLLAMVIFSYLCMFFLFSNEFLSLKNYPNEFGINEVWTIISLVFLSIIVIVFAMWKTKKYFSTTDLQKLQTQFNHFYYRWMPVLSGTISILFYFEGGLDVFLLYIFMGLYFFFIAVYLIFVEEKQKAKTGNLQDLILRIFMPLQFMVQTWVALLLIHFWLNRKLFFLGLLAFFGLVLVMFWLKPGKLVVYHTLTLRLFLYAFGLLIIWVSWTDFDLINQIISTDINNILMKLMVDFIGAYFYLNTLSPKGLQRIIEYYSE